MRRKVNPFEKKEKSFIFRKTELKILNKKEKVLYFWRLYIGGFGEPRTIVTKSSRSSIYKNVLKPPKIRQHENPKKQRTAAWPVSHPGRFTYGQIERHSRKPALSKFLWLIICLTSFALTYFLLAVMIIRFWPHTTPGKEETDRPWNSHFLFTTCRRILQKNKQIWWMVTQNVNSKQKNSQVTKFG